MRVDITNNLSVKYINTLKEKDFTSDNIKNIVDNIMINFDKDCQNGCSELIKKFVSSKYKIQYKNSFVRFKKSLKSDIYHNIIKNMLDIYTIKDKKRLIKIIKNAIIEVFSCCKINMAYNTIYEKTDIEEVIRNLGFELKKIRYTDEIIMVLGKLKYYDNFVEYDEFVENIL